MNLGLAFMVSRLDCYGKRSELRAGFANASLRRHYPRQVMRVSLTRASDSGVRVQKSERHLTSDSWFPDRRTPRQTVKLRQAPTLGKERLPADGYKPLSVRGFQCPH